MIQKVPWTARPPAFVASLALAISIGWYLAWPAALAGGALVYLRHRERLPTQPPLS